MELEEVMREAESEVYENDQSGQPIIAYDELFVQKRYFYRGDSEFLISIYRKGDSFYTYVYHFFCMDGEGEGWKLYNKHIGSLLETFEYLL